MECIWCGFKSNDPIEFEKHLSEEHFLSYQEYCEIELTHQKILIIFASDVINIEVHYLH